MSFLFESVTAVTWQQIVMYLLMNVVGANVSEQIASVTVGGIVLKIIPELIK